MDVRGIKLHGAAGWIGGRFLGNSLFGLHANIAVLSCPSAKSVQSLMLDTPRFNTICGGPN